MFDYQSSRCGKLCCLLIKLTVCTWLQPVSDAGTQPCIDAKGISRQSDASDRAPGQIPHIDRTPSFFYFVIYLFLGYG